MPKSKTRQGKNTNLYLPDYVRDYLSKKYGSISYGVQELTKADMEKSEIKPSEYQKKYDQKTSQK
jgi:hypothetical protein